MATVVRAALRRIGSRALRPSLAAAARLQPHPTPPRYMVAVPHQRWASTTVPAVAFPTTDIKKKFHLEVSGKLLPEIGFTTDGVYTISLCSDNADFASKLVREFIIAIQSKTPEDLEKFLSHKVSIVEVKKLLGGAVMEITLQGMERTAEVRFEIQALKQMVLDESASTRAQVESLKTTVGDTNQKVHEMNRELPEDFFKVVIGGTAVNLLCTFIVYIGGQASFSIVTEAAVEFMKYIST